MTSSPHKILATAAALWIVATASWAAPTSDVAAAIDEHDYVRAAAELRAEVRAAPANDETRFALARVLGRSGDYTGAIAEYDALIAAHPDNVDYVFGRAQALSWAALDDQTLRELERARALAPDYEDVWRLELAVLARGNADRARLAAFRAEASQRFPDADWWQGSDRTANPSRASTMRLTAGTELDSLSNGAPDWKRFFVQVDRRREQGNLHAGISREQRFGLSDLTLSAGADWQWDTRWSAGVDLGFGLDAAFGPRNAFSGWALRSWSQGWETEFRMAHRAYSATSVTSTAVGVARYFGDFRAAYRADLASLDGDASSAAHSVTLNYYASPRTQFNASLVGGQEAESVGPNQVLRTAVRGLTAGGRHTLSERLSLSWWLGSHRQGDLYRRRYVGLSVTAGL